MQADSTKDTIISSPKQEVEDAQKTVRSFEVARKLEANSTLSHVWERSQRFFVAMQFVGLIVAVFLLFSKIPPPGVAVAILSAAAIIMTFHEKMGKWHKILWVVITALFLYIELRAIDHAQDEQLAQQQTVLEKTQNVAELARRNLETVTGDGSHPCIVPQSHASRSGGIPLVVLNRGINPLTGVEIQILSDQEFLDGTSLFRKPKVNIGTLRSEWGKELPDFIMPKLKSDGTAHYLAEIWTQNGFYMETIYFRRGKYLPWAYQYNLAKVTNIKTGKLSSISKNEMIQDCVQNKWSDD